MTEQNTQHLSEDERQSMADGTLSGPEQVRARAHLQLCDDCARDVARLEALLAHARSTPDPTAATDELWPAIRARIDERKSAALPESQRHAIGSGRPVPWLIGIAAAILIALVLDRTRPSWDGFARLTTSDTTAAADSVRAYDEQAKALLAQLELSRAMLRPEAARAIDRDLAVVDSAIGELRVALAHDPRNADMQRLLAQALKQKVDILERAGNAG